MNHSSAHYGTHYTTSHRHHPTAKPRGGVCEGKENAMQSSQHHICGTTKSQAHRNGSYSDRPFHTCEPVLIPAQSALRTGLRERGDWTDNGRSAPAGRLQRAALLSLHHLQRPQSPSPSSNSETDNSQMALHSWHCADRPHSVPYYQLRGVAAVDLDVSCRPSPTKGHPLLQQNASYQSNPRPEVGYMDVTGGGSRQPFATLAPGADERSIATTTASSVMPLSEGEDSCCLQSTLLGSASSRRRDMYLHASLSCSAPTAAPEVVVGPPGESINAGYTLTTAAHPHQPPTPLLFRQQDVEDSHFVREEVLGEGSYSIVRAAVHVPSHRVVALKEISRHRLRTLGLDAQLQWEINVHRRLRHPNIVRLHSYYVTPHAVNLVLEYCSGGTLMQRVHQSSRGFLEEACAARYTRHVARALLHLHRHGLAHRDLKLENALLDARDVAKLADFGWSKQVTASCGPNLQEGATGAAAIAEDGPTVPTGDATPPGEGRRTVCGTLDYLSPEMVSGQPHTNKTDVWSLGVMLVEMLTGTPPFFHRSQHETLEAIRGAVPNFTGRRSGGSAPLTVEDDAGVVSAATATVIPDAPAEVPTLSAAARELALSMLRKDPAARPSMEEVLRHAWLRKRPVDAAPPVESPRRKATRR